MQFVPPCEVELCRTARPVRPPVDTSAAHLGPIYPEPLGHLRAGTFERETIQQQERDQREKYVVSANSQASPIRHQTRNTSPRKCCSSRERCIGRTGDNNPFIPETSDPPPSSQVAKGITARQAVWTPLAKQTSKDTVKHQMLGSQRRNHQSRPVQPTPTCIAQRKCSSLSLRGLTEIHVNV